MGSTAQSFGYEIVVFTYSENNNQDRRVLTVILLVASIPFIPGKYKSIRIMSGFYFFRHFYS